MKTVLPAVISAYLSFVSSVQDTAAMHTSNASNERSILEQTDISVLGLCKLLVSPHSAQLYPELQLDNHVNLGLTNRQYDEERCRENKDPEYFTPLTLDLQMGVVSTEDTDEIWDAAKEEAMEKTKGRETGRARADSPMVDEME